MILTTDIDTPDLTDNELDALGQALEECHFLRSPRPPRQREPFPYEPSQGLAADVGEWLISSYGENLALGFKGSPSFIRRCYNWAVNTCVIGRGQSLHWYYEAVTGKLAYVCPRDMAAIEAGLAAQFRAEIIQNREVPLLKDSWDDETESPVVEFDEARIDAMASQRAKAFMTDRIVRDNFVLSRASDVAPIYGLGQLVRTGNTED